MKGFVSSVTQKVTDENGFERVRTETKQFVYKSDEEPFYNIFLNYVHWMYDISSAVTLKVLLRLLEDAEFNTGRVQLTAGARTDILSSLGISAQALSRSLRELVQADAISKSYSFNKATGEQVERKGEYVINPKMFWKGDLKTRKKLIVEFRAEYDDPDPTVVWDNSSTVAESAQASV